METQIKEIIIVEGRDDENAVRNAVNAQIIKTNGYGIRKQTWERIEKAYAGPGIIIFTDPDYAGELIRKRITERFPSARHAFLSREEARKDRDIGIENASAETIRQALHNARCVETLREDIFTQEDMIRFDLMGGDGSTERRDKLGRSLGIGYGNAKTFLGRLNSFGITREEFYRHGEALFPENHTQHQR